MIHLNINATNASVPAHVLHHDLKNIKQQISIKSITFSPRTMSYEANECVCCGSEWMSTWWAVGCSFGWYMKELCRGKTAQPIPVTFEWMKMRKKTKQIPRTKQWKRSDLLSHEVTRNQEKGEALSKNCYYFSVANFYIRRNTFLLFISPSLYLSLFFVPTSHRCTIPIFLWLRITFDLIFQEKKVSQRTPTQQPLAQPLSHIPQS